MTRTPKRGLRLVETEVRKPVEAREFQATDDVRNLLTPQDPSTLVFLEFDALQEADFVSSVVTVSPTLVFDIRAVPRFDVGNLNRRLVFSIFRTAGARYFDISASLGTGKVKQLASNPTGLAAALREIAFNKRETATGPIIFLCDSVQVEPSFVEAVASELDYLNAHGWKIVKIPEFARSTAMGERATIFLSHATPDDNDFARWLGTQLTLAGYEVWTDFNRLQGGEIFWNTIEDIIRNRAARVIVAASRVAQRKDGVLDEINLAVSVERTLGLDEFVMPLKIDDLPYSEFRANIARKDIIDFSVNWATGLARLLQSLSRGNVPRDNRDRAPEAVAFHSRLSLNDHLREVPDPILLNWIDIKSMPPRMHSFAINAPTHRLSLISKTLLLPNVLYGDQILSFANEVNFRAALPEGTTSTGHGQILTTEFEKARVSQFPALRPQEARKYIVQLIHQAWSRVCEARGLRRYVLSNNAIAWFAPIGLIDGKVAFVDREGVTRRKSLVGFSAKRGVHWHFAVELRVAPGSPLRLIVRPHVVFTDDGKTPLESSNRMHTLRRGFCKSWWNDRWRDLSIAYLAWMAGDSETIDLEVGADEPLSLSSKLIEESAPVSPEESLDSEGEADLDSPTDFDDAELDDEEILLMGSDTLGSSEELV